MALVLISIAVVINAFVNRHLINKLEEHDKELTFQVQLISELNNALKRLQRIE